MSDETLKAIEKLTYLMLLDVQKHPDGLKSSRYIGGLNEQSSAYYCKMQKFLEQIAHNRAVELSMRVTVRLHSISAVNKDVSFDLTADVPVSLLADGPYGEVLMFRQLVAEKLKEEYAPKVAADFSVLNYEVNIF